ncbi:hypothetical protein BH10ACT3_BH10ACT3_10880 [soil metagenome]
MSNAGPPTALAVYWRPGCPYCFSLKRALKRRKIPVRLHNIWEDPSAASVVREAAHGNETVPTVVLGNKSLVNPSASQVEQMIASVAPSLLPSRSVSRPKQAKVSKGQSRGSSERGDSD